MRYLLLELTLLDRFLVLCHPSLVSCIDHKVCEYQYAYLRWMATTLFHPILEQARRPFARLREQLLLDLRHCRFPIHQILPTTFVIWSKIDFYQWDWNCWGDRDRPSLMLWYQQHRLIYTFSLRTRKLWGSPWLMSSVRPSTCKMMFNCSAIVVDMLVDLWSIQ